MAGPTDEALMEQFCAGNNAAFNVLFERHAGRVRGFLVRMVRDGALADDLSQAAFLSVVRSRGRYVKGTKFSSWLLTIAANAARDALRHQRHVTAHARAPVGDEGVAPAPSGDPALRDALSSALAQLPIEQREAVVLSKVEGWSFEEIAELQQTSVGNARVRAHRGNEKLKSLLAGVA